MTTTERPGIGLARLMAVRHRGHDLRDLHAMWWRRPQPFVLDDAIADSHDRAFARGECAAMVAGLWRCLDAEWVNDPDRDEAASRKMWQLRVASELGLRVPRTCMTNSPELALAFIDSEPGTVVFKSFSATEVTWRETRMVGDQERELLDRVRLAPVIFQECIPGGFDIRVTIVGDQAVPCRDPGRRIGVRPRLPGRHRARTHCRSCASTPRGGPPQGDDAANGTCGMARSTCASRPKATTSSSRSTLPASGCSSRWRRASRSLRPWLSC